MTMNNKKINLFSLFFAIAVIAVLVTLIPLTAQANSSHNNFSRMVWTTTKSPALQRDLANSVLDGSGGGTGSDILVFHYGAGSTPTTTQTDAMKAVTAIANTNKGAEFFSLADITANAAFIKAQGLGFISYDLEQGASPQTEVDDPVNSMVTAKSIANTNGLNFMPSPSHKISDEHAADIVTALGGIVYRYHLQSQPQQADDQTCAAEKAWVEDKVAELEAVNPNMNARVSYQVTLTGNIATGDPDAYTTAKRCVDAIQPTDADGLSIWWGSAQWTSGQYQDLLTYFENTYS